MLPKITIFIKCNRWSSFTETMNFETGNTAGHRDAVLQGAPVVSFFRNDSFFISF